MKPAPLTDEEIVTLIDPDNNLAGLRVWIECSTPLIRKVEAAVNSKWEQKISIDRALLERIRDAMTAGYMGRHLTEYSVCLEKVKDTIQEMYEIT